MHGDTHWTTHPGFEWDMGTSSKHERSHNTRMGLVDFPAGLKHRHMETDSNDTTDLFWSSDSEHGDPGATSAPEAEPIHKDEDPFFPEFDSIPDSGVPPAMPASIDPVETGAASSSSVPVISSVPVPSMAHYFTEYGRVTFYSKSNSFEAKCKVPCHGDCRLTRTANQPTGRRLLTHPHQGRPVAALVAWLDLATLDSTSAEHKAQMPTFAQRRAVRTRLKDAGPQAQLLLAGERAQAPYEDDSEPSDIEPFDHF